MTRTDVPPAWDERSTLNAMLDYARATVRAAADVRRRRASGHPAGAASAAVRARPAVPGGTAGDRGPRRASAAYPAAAPEPDHRRRTGLTSLPFTAAPAPRMGAGNGRADARANLTLATRSTCGGTTRPAKRGKARRRAGQLPAGPSGVRGVSREMPAKPPLLPTGLHRQQHDQQRQHDETSEPARRQHKSGCRDNSTL